MLSLVLQMLYCGMFLCSTNVSNTYNKPFKPRDVKASDTTQTQAENIIWPQLLDITSMSNIKGHPVSKVTLCIGTVLCCFSLFHKETPLQAGSNNPWRFARNGNISSPRKRAAVTVETVAWSTQRTVLGSGREISAHSVGAPCSGASAKFNRSRSTNILKTNRSRSTNISKVNRSRWTSGQPKNKSKDTLSFETVVTREKLENLM